MIYEGGFPEGGNKNGNVLFMVSRVIWCGNRIHKVTKEIKIIYLITYFYDKKRDNA